MKPDGAREAGGVSVAALVLAVLGPAQEQAKRADGAGAFPVPPAAHESLERALAAGVDWLVAHQGPEGSFGSYHSARPIEVLSSVPGSLEAFRVATTALCFLALREAASGREGAEEAAERALGYLIEGCAVKRQSGLEHYNVWSFGYALQCLAGELAREPPGARAAELRSACERLVAALGRYQTLDGGWGYLSMNPVPTWQPSDTSMSFTTATILLGVERARAAGIEVPASLVERAVGEIQRSRLPDGAFLYGDYLRYVPRLGINERAGSACRAPVCLLALDRLGAEVAPADFERALEDLLVRFPDYQKSGVRRPIPHETWFYISGYFYLYGHAYAAWALEELPAEKRRPAAERIVQAVMYCRDPDGSFWDYPLYSYHKPYGTAFALIALARARRVLGER
jgi:hypothetical protein